MYTKNYSPKIHIHKKYQCLPRCEGCGLLDRCFNCPRRNQDRDCGCQFALLHRADTESQHNEDGASHHHGSSHYSGRHNRRHQRRHAQPDDCIGDQEQDSFDTSVSYLSSFVLASVSTIHQFLLIHAIRYTPSRIPPSKTSVPFFCFFFFSFYSLFRFFVIPFVCSIFTLSLVTGKSLQKF